jgi:CHAT domain-containing protein
MSKGNEYINFYFKEFCMRKKMCGICMGRVLFGVFQLIVLLPFSGYAQSTDRRDAAVWQNAETAFEYAESRRSGGFLDQLGMVHSVKPNPITVQSAKQWCGDDRVILEYVIGGPGSSLSAEETYCIVLTKDTVDIVALDRDFDYAANVRALRGKIFNNPRGKLVLLPESAFEDERNALYSALIRPVLPHIPANVRNIVIIPNGHLAYLPFDILRESKDNPDIGEQYVITFSPSVSVSAFISRNRSHANESFLGFGGALYNGYYGSFEDGSPILWPPLNGSTLEVNAIKRYFAASSQIFTGREASEARIKAMSVDGSLAAYSILHFACHGYFNPGEPEKLGILLSEISGQLRNSAEDGNLTAEEVRALKINAGMVTLTTSSSGIGYYKAGDEIMISLARSFMIAGAGSVGVNLWEIDDRVTASFMTRLYRYVKEEGINFREAYYRTRNEFREGENAHPYYWAAFTMYE